MSEAAEYAPFACLPVPVLVVRGEQVAFANPALLSLLGLEREKVHAASVRSLMEHLSPEACSWLEPLPAAGPREEPPSDTLCLRVRVAGGQERTFSARRGGGQHPGDVVVVLLDAEESTRRLTEALAHTAGELVRCRDEQAVLEMAADIIHRQGFFVSVMLLDGDEFIHGPLRQDPTTLAAAEQLCGKPLYTRRYPRVSLPHLEEPLRQRRAAFHPDVYRFLEHRHAPEVLTPLRRAYASVNALDVPLIIEGEPYGLFSIQGAGLTPASAATLELFARHVSGALENVRQHQLVTTQLSELSRLQADLVAQERMMVLGEAAGVVAHEVRNPLGAILNAAAVLKREKLGPIGSSAVEMLEEEATRLDAMVRDLLEVVRPLEPRPRPVHPGALARRVLALFQERHPPGAVRLVVDEEPDLPVISADENLLQLALESLMRNAVQASPPGGLVRVGVKRAPRGVALLVEDEGPGISSADAQRIFEPFFTTRTTGTGLGLAVVRRVVLAHGGTVSAEQRPGGGARFQLVLPG